MLNQICPTYLFWILVAQITKFINEKKLISIYFHFFSSRVFSHILDICRYYQLYVHILHIFLLVPHNRDIFFYHH